MEKIRIGNIICDRYHTCGGGKCLYDKVHTGLGTWEGEKWPEILAPTLEIEDVRRSCD